MKKKIICLFLLSLSFLHAQEPDSQSHSSLVNFEGIPSATIAGCVNVISGDYSDFQIDVVIPGPQPLTLERSYISSNFDRGSLCHGWESNHTGKLECGSRIGGPDRSQLDVSFKRAHGETITYTHLVSDYQLECKYGITNCGRGEISGRTNLKNLKVIPKNKKLQADRANGCELVFGNGEKYVFGKGYSFSRLKEIIRPNKTKTEYEYDEKFHIKKVEQKNHNKTSLASLQYMYPKKSAFKKTPSLEVVTSDNRTVKYKYERLKHLGDHHDFYTLSEVERPNAPTEKYTYQPLKNKLSHKKPKVCRKERPEGRFQEIQYYGSRFNKVRDTDIMLSGKKDPIYLRVATLKEPLEANGDPVVSYRFFYHPEQDDMREYTKGTTEVYDALDYLRKFDYDYSRLQRINYFKGKGKYEKFWSETFSWCGTNLSSRTVEDAEGRVFLSRNYTYDQRGNILVDSLYGNLTGKSESPIDCPRSWGAVPNCDECYQKRFSYSDDGLNLRVEEKDSKIRTTYAYIDGTELLGIKLLWDGNRVKTRFFYEYDDNGMMTKEICDDGHEGGKDDLLGVSQRMITEFTRYHTAPVGYPKEMIQKYLDLDTGEEVQLKRTVYQFSIEGYKTQEDIYDSNDQYVYSNYWEYHPSGKATKEVNALGNTIVRKYDLNENLIFEQGPRLDVHKKFYYDFKNRLIREEEIFDDGTFLAKRYQYDYVGNCIKKNDIYGNDILCEYDEFGQMIKVLCPPILSKEGAAQQHSIKTAYNIFGQQTAVEDANGYMKKQKFNIRGKPTEIIHADGSKELFEYNLEGTLRRETAKNGVVTLYEYDFIGRVTKKEVYSAQGDLLTTTSSVYDSFHLIKEIDAAGVATDYTYDFAGRLKRKTKGVEEERYEYDTLGRCCKVIKMTDESDAIVEVKEFDLLNQIIAERLETLDGRIQSQKRYEYDCSGNRILETKETQNGLSSTYYEYNAHGELTKKTDAEGNVTTIRYKYSHVNEFGQYVGYRETMDPLGNASIVIKDVRGRDTTFIRKNPFGQTVQKAEIQYDGNGNKIKRVDTVFGDEEPNREVTTCWFYDPTNNVIRTVEAVGTPEQKTTEVRYNRYGQKSHVIKSDGVVLCYEYNPLGLLEHYYSDDNSIDYTYEYDLICRPLDIYDRITDQHDLKVYDDNGRIRKETLGNELEIQYAYDRQGRIQTITLPDHSSIRYVFDGNNLSKIERLDPLQQSKYHHSYLEYDQTGKCLRSQLIDGASEVSYAYDLLGRVRKIETEHWRENIAGFDDAGNLIERTVEDAKGQLYEGYKYDDLYQLIEENGPLQQRYRYDSLNNRLKKNEDDYKINSLNQLLDDSNSQYSYDLSGNIIKKTTFDHELSYEYDALNRLVTFFDHTFKVSYGYDSSNRRITKTLYEKQNDEWTKVQHERFLYIQEREIGSYDENDVASSLRVLGTGLGAEIGAAIAIEIEEQVFAPVHDHNGNVTCLIDIETQQPFETYRYTAYGEETLLNSSGQEVQESNNPWRFCSKRKDPHLQMIYFGQRYYDPAVGRWNTPDPIGQRDGPNLYAYLQNNPLTNLDLWGLCAKCGIDNYTWGDRMREGAGEALTDIGNAIQTVSRELLFVPAIRDAVSFVGHALTGGSFDDFVSAKQDTTSCVDSLKGRQLSANETIMFINGIKNTLQNSKDSAETISDKCGGVSLHIGYNSTHGFLADLLECLGQILGFPTNSVNVATSALKECIANVGGVDAGGKVYVFAHSQGGLVLWRALQRLTSEERAMIHVRTFGSAKMIQKDDLGSAINYVSSRDAVPFIADPIGCLRGAFSADSNVTFLNSDHYPLIDHPVTNDTYQSAIARETQNIMQNYGVLK